MKHRSQHRPDHRTDYIAGVQDSVLGKGGKALGDSFPA